MPSQLRAETLLHALAARGEPPGGSASAPASSGIRFVDRHERVTELDTATIWQRALTAAAALHARGIRSGEVVGLMLPTCPGFLDAWLGCQVLGAIPAAVYPPVRLGRLDEFFDRTAAMLSSVHAVALVTEPRIRRMLGQLVTRWSPARGLIDVGELRSASTAAAPPRRLPEASELQMIQFSSGTTVTPKPVALTHGQTMANASRICQVILDACPPHLPPSGVSWLPLYHDMGLIGGLFPPILVPGWLTLIAPEDFLAKPALWLRAMSQTRATISPAPDFAYALCVERIRDEEIEGIDLSDWRLALDGAEPVSPRTLRAFQERFGAYGLRPEALTPVYGLAEMALAVTFSPWQRPPTITSFDPDSLQDGRAVAEPDGIELVAVGTPLPDYAVQIRDGERQPLRDGRIGHIWAAGPSRMYGYLQRDDAPFDGEWLDTGDLGFIHGGQLYISGRAKDLLVIRGRNHAPQDLERAVDVVPGVRTGCAAAVADLGSDGEQVLLFVEVRHRYTDQADACVRAVMAATSVVPHLVVILEAGTLPRTSSGKIRRSETLARWKAGTLTPPDEVTPLMLAGAFASSAMGFLQARWGALRRG